MNKCPKCGADAYGLIEASGAGIYKCGSTDQGFDPEHPEPFVSVDCLRRQLAAANERAMKLERELVERGKDVMHAALAACDESPWRSMDSAPKDGKQFLAVVDGRVREVAWTKTSHVPLWGWCLVDQGIEDRDFCEPTHWMPLPAAPEAARTGEEENA